ncbi:MAG: hypothetical protein K2X01_11940 [Cyanobacteria bacterium]|nr:hypothetical protein [Cyanobacteriota bacterium]
MKPLNNLSLNSVSPQFGLIYKKHPAKLPDNQIHPFTYGGRQFFATGGDAATLERDHQEIDEAMWRGNSTSYEALLEILDHDQRRMAARADKAERPLLQRLLSYLQ